MLNLLIWYMLGHNPFLVFPDNLLFKIVNCKFLIFKYVNAYYKKMYPSTYPHSVVGSHTPTQPHTHTVLWEAPMTYQRLLPIPNLQSQVAGMILLQASLCTFFVLTWRSRSDLRCRVLTLLAALSL